MCPWGPTNSDLHFEKVKPHKQKYASFPIFPSTYQLLPADLLTCKTCRRSLFRVQTRLKDDRRAKVLSLSAVWLTFHEGISCIQAPQIDVRKLPSVMVFRQSEADQSVSFEVKKTIALFDI